MNSQRFSDEVHAPGHDSLPELRLIRFKRTWPVRVLKNCEPPASLKPPSSPRKTFLESREEAAFKKIAAPFRETRNNATKREAFWLPHFSGGRRKSLLGVLRALSEAGGSFFISTFQPDEPELMHLFDDVELFCFRLFQKSGFASTTTRISTPCAYSDIGQGHGIANCFPHHWR